MSYQEAGRICAGCGASNAAEAQFCGLCGRELPGGAASEADGDVQGHPNGDPWQDSASAAPPDSLEYGNSDLGEMANAAQAPAEGQMQKRCAWCGSLNPWIAAVCVSCEARFPVPGQDEAFLRAAEERLRQEEANLDALRQRRRRSWRWFLR
jgi:ribosomal protein L40E